MTQSGTLNDFWMKWTSSGVSLHIGFLASMTDNTSRTASSSLFWRTCTSSSLTSEPIKKLNTISLSPSQLKYKVYNHITLFYLHAIHGFSLKLVLKYEVLLNSCMQHQTRLCQTGPCGVKTKAHITNHHVISPLFRYTAQCSAVIIYWCFGTKYRFLLQVSRNQKTGQNTT